jgi:RimJ/RimL family protein N-acetyltransferase
MKIEYHIIPRAELNDAIRATFAEKLKKQNKVAGDPNGKADRCKFLCVVSIDSKSVAIGAIKVATKSDFNEQKAAVPELEKDFEWELGYLFTEPSHEGRGIGSYVVRLLLETYGRGKLMASTEIRANPGMVHILEKQGFRLFGKTWESMIHSNQLGLFLRFESR